MRWADDQGQSHIEKDLAVGCWTSGVSHENGLSGLSAISDDLIVVADAIIDNRDALLIQLDLIHEKPARVSNADLILYAFRKWGMDCLQRMHGDYAFVVIDRQNKEVFLARDHIGTRPLFWSHRENTLLFSTSIEALVNIDDFDWHLDQAVIAEYLACPLTPVSKPFFTNISAVSGGCYTRCCSLKSETKRWWNPETWPKRSTKGLSSSIVHECRRLLNQAVKMRVRTKHSVASHFSGGIDSSGVTILANRYLQTQGANLTAAYTWSPPISSEYPLAKKHDERHLIESISKREHFAIKYGSSDAGYLMEFVDRPMEFESEADLLDELPILKASELDRTKIILSGWGGDEAFSAHGVAQIGFLLRSGKLKEAIAFARQKYKSLRSVRALFKLAWRELIHPILPEKLYHRLHPNQLYRKQTSFASESIIRENRKLFRHRHHTIKFGYNPTQNLKRYLLAGHVQMRMTSWAAWSRPYGYQYRYPLTDRALLEFILSLHPENIYLGNRSRGLARAVLADCVPEDANKRDHANELLRNETRQKGWLALKQSAKQGRYENECPWIDKAAFLRALEAIKDQAIPDNSILFYEILVAARVWSMYERGKAHGWV